MLSTAGLYRLADQFGTRSGTISQRVDQRQRRFSLGQVITEVLATLFGIGLIIEHIVDQLICGPQMPSIDRERTLGGLVRATDHGRNLTTRLEQARSLAI